MRSTPDDGAIRDNKAYCASHRAEIYQIAVVVVTREQNDPINSGVKEMLLLEEQNSTAPWQAQLLLQFSFAINGMNRTKASRTTKPSPFKAS